MIIRDETPGDVKAISDIHYAAFTNHPQHAPGAEPTEHKIVERLREAGDLAVSLVAENREGAVGHIALSPASVGSQDRGWFLLGPIGVLPEHQGKGVGSALLEEAVERLRNRDAAGIVLVGDPGFYARFGFTSVDGLAYSEIPSRFVLALTLGARLPQGEITPHPAFGA